MWYGNVECNYYGNVFKFFVVHIQNLNETEIKGKCQNFDLNPTLKKAVFPLIRFCHLSY